MDFMKDLSGRHILRISQTTEAPDFVKEASILPDDIAALPDSAFALPHKREFPIDTPGHVWLSYAYCKSAAVHDADLLTKLQRAGELYGIEDQLKKIDADFSELTKQASVDKQFAIVIDFGAPDPAADVLVKRAGGIQGFYPINSPFEIEASAVKMSNAKARIPLELFAEGCRNLVKAATDKGMNLSYLPEKVLAYGIERVPSPEVVQHYAGMRKEATGDDLYLQIADAALQNPEQRGSHEWAELWINADRQNNFKAAKHEPDPFLLFNSGPTVAELNQEIERWVDIAGAPVPVTKVAMAREEVVRKWFPKGVADRLCELVKEAAHKTGTELTAAFAELDNTVASTFVKRVILT